MTPAEELMVYRLCRRLHRLGERASEEFVLELICRCSWRRPIVGRLTESVTASRPPAAAAPSMRSTRMTRRARTCTCCGCDDGERPAITRKAAGPGRAGGLKPSFPRHENIRGSPWI
jgi:hypothetical protein